MPSLPKYWPARLRRAAGCRADFIATSVGGGIGSGRALPCTKSLRSAPCSSILTCRMRSQTMERIAYKHNAAQSEDCPTYRGNQQKVPRHLGAQMGLHVLSGALRGFGWPLQVSYSTPTSCPGREILLVTHVTANATFAAASRAWALAFRPNPVWDGGLFCPPVGSVTRITGARQRRA